MRVEAL